MASSKGKNRGELSELYVFLDLLNNSKVHAADSNLNRLDDVFYIVKKVIRDEGNGRYEYAVSADGSGIEISEKGKLLVSISHDVVERDREWVLDSFKEESSSGVLYIDGISDVLSNYRISKVSQNSSSKADITLELYDYHTGIDRVLPFSIKSFAGANPTLVNSSRLTNFIFKIDGTLSNEDVTEINDMSVYRRNKAVADISGRVNAIFERGCDLEFFGMHSPVYEGNLRLVDTKLPEILAEILKLKFTAGISDIAELTEMLSKSNPLNFKGKQPYYEYKISKFLMESFTGMVPRYEWDGYEDTHGGYIVVKEDMEVLCLHLNNRNEFEKYLFNRSYLDTYSTTRSEYAKIEKTIDGDLIFKLNLVIRLRK